MKFRKHFTFALLAAVSATVSPQPYMDGFSDPPQQVENPRARAPLSQTPLTPDGQT